MKPLTVIPASRKMGIPFKNGFMLFMGLMLFFASPLLAQNTDVPRTRTFPGIENPAFPYAQPEEVGLSTEKLNRLGNEITSWVENGELVGAELLIIKDGKSVFHEAYGWSDIEERRPMDRSSIFSIQSMSKSYTATAILMLIEDGKLSLDEPVSKYISNFPDNNTKIHHLLSQTSGFDMTDEIRPTAAAGFKSMREWVEVLVTDKRAAPLGTYRYTDYNYNFLGQIIEEVSGLPADVFIEKNVLQPLGLEETFTAYAPDVSWADRMNSRYRWNEEARAYRSYWTRRDEQPWPFYPASNGLFSTAMDYSKFMTMWMNGGEHEGTRLLSENSVTESLQLHGSMDAYRGYGYGWFVRDPKRVDGMPHSFFHGGIDGTLALAFPAENAIVVFLTHSRGREHRTALVNRLGMYEIFNGAPYSPNLLLPHQAGVVEKQLKAEAQALYVGTYRGEGSDWGNALVPVVRVWNVGGRLHLRIGELGERADMYLHLVPLGDHQFALGRYRDEQLESVDPNGRIRFIVQNGETLVLEVGTANQIQFSARSIDPGEILAEIEAEKSRISIDKIILKTLNSEGIEAARVHHHALLASFPDSVRFGVSLLNALGYRLLREEHIEEAIAVFEMNVDAYPEAANPYDSLADAYRAARRLEDARRNYQRAVELAEHQEHENLEAYRKKLKQVTQQLEEQ